MKSIMRRMISACVWWTMLFGAQCVNAETVTITGEISMVGADSINLDHEIYPIQGALKGVDMSKAMMGNALSSNSNGVKVLYLGAPMTYETILNIGQVTSARVTLVDGMVTEIDILEMD